MIACLTCHKNRCVDFARIWQHIHLNADEQEIAMLEILARSFLIATRSDMREDREKLARQRRWEDEYFWQGRSGTPGEWRGR